MVKNKAKRRRAKILGWTNFIYDLDKFGDYDPRSMSILISSLILPSFDRLFSSS
jgi:hypothetical protein